MRQQRYSAKEDLLRRERKQLKHYRQGQADRKAGKGMLSANGRYLEGWHDPEKQLPDFLTQTELDSLEP